MYKTPIISGILIFLFILYLTFIPYIIYSYRKYNDVSKAKTLVYYSFILYIITAYFMVILPLPSKEYVAKLTTPKYSLVPFRFVYDFINESGLNIKNISTYLKALRHPSFYTVFFNLLLTLPLGIYLKTYFKFDLKKSVLIGFLTSLFFEMSQLTGLFFIYPRPYRLFDVDDLIVNTLGTFVGYKLAPSLSIILPKIPKEEKKARSSVTFLRRFIAFVVDILIVDITQSIILKGMVFVGFTSINTLLVEFVIAFVYFTVLIYSLDGMTLGMAFLKIKMVSTLNEYLTYRQIVLRNVLPILVIKVLPDLNEGINWETNISQIFVWLNIILMLLAIIFYIIIIIDIIRKKDFLYERLSYTKLIVLD